MNKTSARRRITLTAVSLILLAGIFATIITVPVQNARASPPHTVANVPNTSHVNDNPICPGFEQCVANIAGLWWAIYTNGSVVFYKTSSDGATWGSAHRLFTTGASQVQDPTITLCSDGYRLYFVVATGENAGGNTTVFGYLFGIANANSTITVQGGGSVKTHWGFPIGPACQATSPNNFNVVVGTFDVSLGNGHVEVWHYNNVVWTLWKDILGDALGTWAGTLVLVPNGYILWYGNSFTENFFSTSATGASWTSGIPFHDFNSFWSSATTIGNTIYVSASSGDNNTIYLVKCTYPCGSLSHSVALSGLNGNFPATGIASDSVATLSIGFCDNATKGGPAVALKWITSSNAGGTWSSVNTETPNPECQGSSGNVLFSALPQIISGNQAVYYSNAGSGTTINARFDLLATGSSTTSTTNTTTTTSSTTTSSSSLGGSCGTPTGHTGGTVLKYVQGGSFAATGTLPIALTAGKCLIIGMHDECTTYGGAVGNPFDSFNTNFFPLNSGSNFASYVCNPGFAQRIGEVYMTYGTIPSTGTDTITFPTFSQCLPPFEPCVLGYFAMEVDSINSAITFQQNSCWVNATLCASQTIQVPNPYAGTGILVAIAGFAISGTSGFKFHAINVGGVQVNDSKAVTLPTRFPFGGSSSVWAEVALGSVSTNPTVTVTRTVACNFYQEQCWWIPTIYLGMYIGLWMTMALSINARARSLTFVLGASSSYATLWMILLGLLPYPFAIITVALALAYALRLDGVF